MRRFCVFSAVLERSTGTFHQYPEDVSEDGDGGAQDEHGEQERADGICHFVLGLEERKTVCGDQDESGEASDGVSFKPFKSLRQKTQRVGHWGGRRATI